MRYFACVEVNTMTRPDAIRQLVAIFGGPALHKGALYEEPMHGHEPPIAMLMGQSDYIASMLRFRQPGAITCPFVPDTPDAALWAAGKLRERKHERAVVEAYARSHHNG